MDSGYQQQPVGGGRVLFTVIPAPAPRSSGLPMVAGLVVGLVVFVAVPRPGLASLLLHVLAAMGIGCWIFRSSSRWLAGRMNRARAPGGRFVASALGIETDGASIPSDRIERLVVRNAVLGIADTVVVGPAAHGPGPRGNATDPLVRGTRAAASSFMLCVEYGGAITTIAGGMTAGTAHGLLADVIRVLGLSRRRSAADLPPAPAGSGAQPLDPEPQPSAETEAPAHR